MVQAWTNFARTGNPNGSGNSPWPRYQAKKHTPGMLSQNIPVSSSVSDAEFSKSHQCDFWDATLSYKPRAQAASN